MSVLTIKAKELTKEGFAPYGSAVCIPTDGNPDRPTAVSYTHLVHGPVMRIPNCSREIAPTETKKDTITANPQAVQVK